MASNTRMKLSAYGAGDGVDRPEQRPRRVVRGLEARRRRGDAGGRHERQRGLRVPRRRPVDPARGVHARPSPTACRSAPRSSLPRPARVRPAVHRHRPARAARRRALPARRARRLRPGRRGRGRLRQAARRAVPRHRSTTRPRPRRSSPRPPSTTRRWPCSARPARRCCGPPRPPASNPSPRRSPTGPTCRDGRLVPRSEPDALVVEPAEVAARAVRLATEHEVVVRRRHRSSRSRPRSLCVHGDTPGAVELARAVRDALDAAGVDRARPSPRDGHGCCRTGRRRGCVEVDATTSSAAPRPRAVAGPSGRRGRAGGAHRARAARARRRPRRASADWLALRVGADGAGRRAIASDAVEIAVDYDGEDLAARRRGVRSDDDEVVARHTAATYRVRVLRLRARVRLPHAGSTRRSHLPRRATPRTRVPAGSVAIAAEYTAVYPTASPGGWHLLGHTDAVAVGRRPRSARARSRPGTTVRFVAARDRRSSSSTPAGRRRSRTPAGPGTPPSASRRAAPSTVRLARLLNRLVGNPPDAAVLETLGGLRVRARRPVRRRHVRRAGAARRARPARSSSVEPAAGAPVGLPRRARRHRRRARCSARAARTRCRASVRRRSSPAPRCRSAPIPERRSSSTRRRRARRTRAGRASGPARARLVRRRRAASSSSTTDVDRLRRRQPGRRPARRTAAAAASSTASCRARGWCTGAIQVPPDGRPVVMLADHPTTGGYPVIAVVDPACAAHRRPGAAPARSSASASYIDRRGPSRPGGTT